MKYKDTQGAARQQRKDKPMWVFDGEEWSQDDVGEAKVKRDTTPQRLEEMPFSQPQLQIVDVTELWKRKKVPPYPQP